MISDFAARIEHAGERFGHRLGWRFLYTPASTLSDNTRLAFIGLNPGGSVYVEPIISVEAGNAYRVERWGLGGNLNPLQIQVCRMYGEISKRLSSPRSAIDLMDESLTANFCPFRSPSWDLLANRPASLSFSEGLWTDILTLVQPRAVLCLGTNVEQYLSRIIKSSGARMITEHARSAGWGEVTYSVSRFESDRGVTVLLRLPHLSRFGIFGRAQSAHAVAEIATTVAEILEA